jgi:mannose-1-phosphate guanylyltransferase
VIYPSDHFVYPEDSVIELLRHAALGVELLTGRLILLGVKPDRLEPDYGWVCPGSILGWYGGQLHAVSAFLEKPDPSEAQAAMAAGALWNTFVIVAKVETLWWLGWCCFPLIMHLFEQLQGVIGTAAEDSMLDTIYRIMPARNFSRALLQRVPSRMAVMELSGVLWSDWGKPERVAESLAQIGKQPAFALDYARVS